MASKRSVGIVASTPAISSSAASSVPIGRLGIASRVLAAKSRVNVDAELKRIITGLFPDSEQATQLSELKTANGAPFFTLGNRELLLEAAAIVDSLGFDAALAFFRQARVAQDLIDNSPIPALAEVHNNLEREDNLLLKGKEQVTESQYQCGALKCKSRRIAFYQKQTRSGDEGATTFLRCTACGKQWQERG